MPKKPQLYQIKVTLKGVKPPIWRRLVISNATPLDELHEILQVAMGWTDFHLHQFVAGDRRYGVPDPDWDLELLPESETRIGSLLKRSKDWILYEYDFGDGWVHRIELEKKLPAASVGATPRCTAGRRACPLEDSGGPGGYMQLVAAIRDSSHPEHRDARDWAGQGFDPEAFDTAQVTESLKSSFGAGETEAGAQQGLLFS